MEIAVYPSPAQLQDSFRVPRVFLSTVWGIKKITVNELVSYMYLPQGNALEASVLASVSYGEVMIRFLDFPPVKAIQFALSVTLIIGYSNGTKLKVEDKFGPLPHI